VVDWSIGHIKNYLFFAIALREKCVHRLVNVVYVTSLNNCVNTACMYTDATKKDYDVHSTE
jgi:hypothetical protein